MKQFKDTKIAQVAKKVGREIAYAAKNPKTYFYLLGIGAAMYGSTKASAQADTVKPKYSTMVEIMPTLQLNDVNGVQRNFSAYTLRQFMPLTSAIRVTAEQQFRVEANANAKPIIGVADKPNRVRSQTDLKADAKLVNSDEGTLDLTVGGYWSNNPDREVLGENTWTASSKGAYGKLSGQQKGIRSDLSGGIEYAGAGQAPMIDARVGMSYKDSLDLFGITGVYDAGFDYVYSQQTTRQNFGFVNMVYSSTTEGKLFLKIDLGKDTKLLLGGKGGRFHQDIGAGLEFDNGMQLFANWKNYLNNVLNTSGNGLYVGVKYRY